MKVVVDTNVMVSGLLSPHGPPAMVVRWLAGGQVRACYDAGMLAEYREVLLRPAFALQPSHVEEFLRQLCASGVLAVALPLSIPLPDADDEPFLGVALAAHVRCLVTGNLRHFPVEARSGVCVVSPAEFVQKVRGELRGA